MDDFPEWVYIRVRRPEGYHDVCDELVMEDANMHPAFQYEILGEPAPDNQEKGDD